MKRTLLLTVGLMGWMAGIAQLPKWIISPSQDSITIKVDDCILQADSADYTVLWSMDGKRLYGTQDSILPYHNGVATVARKSDGKLVGIVDIDGKVSALPAVEPIFDMPYFEDNYLLAQDGDSIFYYAKDGSQVDMWPAAMRCYPFHHGYAPYFTFDKPDKMKDPCYGFYRSDGEPMEYRVIEDGVPYDVEPRDIKFLSAVMADGKAIGVVKDKFYWFVTDSATFEPIEHGNAEPAKKRQLSLMGRMDNYFANLPSDSIEISAKYGKEGMAVLRFDSHLRPVEIDFGEGNKLSFTEKPKSTTSKFTYIADMKTNVENGKLGLTIDGKQVIPEQFEDVGLIYGKNAIVKLNGKWGLLKVIPGNGYKIKVNNGQDVAFLHQNYETKLRVDLPGGISAKDVEVVIPSDAGYEIDKNSRQNNDTENGSYLTYDCVLHIPATLADTLTHIAYAPITLNWDGVTLFAVPVEVNAWHPQFYNVDLLDSQTSVENGMASFTVNVDTQNSGDGYYPFDVKVEADSLDLEYGKLSENRYRCMIPDLKEGTSTLNVVVSEQGCPPTVFPIEVSYTKPDVTNKTKEKVVVRRKLLNMTKVTHKAQAPKVEVEAQAAAPVQAPASTAATDTASTKTAKV